MKKIIALAAAAAVLGACDPYNDEPGGTPAVTFVWAGGYDAAKEFYGVEDSTAPYALADAAISASSVSLAFIVKANVLLNGASIENEPQTCVPAGATGADPDGWLTITAPAGLAGGSWYTCYYPSTPTDTEPGGAIWIFYAAEYDAPLETGFLTAGDYTIAGTVKTKSGADLPINFSVTVAP